MYMYMMSWRALRVLQLRHLKTLVERLKAGSCPRSLTSKVPQIFIQPPGAYRSCTLLFSHNSRFPGVITQPSVMKDFVSGVHWRSSVPICISRFHGVITQPSVMKDFVSGVHRRSSVPICGVSSGVRASEIDIKGFIDNQEDFETFVAQLQEILELDPKSEVPLLTLRTIVQKLLALDSDTRNIRVFVQTHPAILTAKSERLSQNMDYLLELGLNWRRLLKVLDEPTIWSASLHFLQSRVHLLRKLGFMEGSLQKVISDWPKILTIRSSKVKGVIQVLMENCGFSKADVLTILSDSPSVLADSLDYIEVKFQYVFFRMGITSNAEMAGAKIFHYSLDHIRCRHLILERMGFYAAPDNRGRFATMNPALARIVDSSDNRFAEKVASVSTAELHAFARTLQEEIRLDKHGRWGLPEKKRSVDMFNDSFEEPFEGTDDLDDDNDDESGSDGESLFTNSEETEPFDFDKVDYRKKR